MSVKRNRTSGLVIAAVLIGLVGAAFLSAGSPRGATGTPGATPESGCASPVASPEASPDAAGGSSIVSVAETVTISLTDSGFEPNYVQATSGHDLTITLHNTGSRDHGFAIDFFAIAELLEPGETKTIVIHNRLEIDVNFYSTAPCDDGMTGELTFYI